MNPQHKNINSEGDFQKKIPSKKYLFQLWGNLIFTWTRHSRQDPGESGCHSEQCDTRRTWRSCWNTAVSAPPTQYRLSPGTTRQPCRRTAPHPWRGWPRAPSSRVCQQNCWQDWRWRQTQSQQVWCHPYPSQGRCLL